MKRIMAMILCLALCLSAAMPAWAAPVYRADELKMEKEAVLSALYEAEITQIREAIDLGLVTCEELTAYYLERIEVYDEPYNCFITLCDDALEVARSRDAQLEAGEAQGRLFGIPIVIKDNMNLTGYHTTNGHKKTNSQIAKTNADVVQVLLDEGAVIIGKTNMSTDAQDALRSYSAAAGETKNAYNPELAAGGSSGGSAVAVSLNFAAAALGTDTNSSLRIPAALAGCVSLRPTMGLLPNTGIKKLNSSRDTPGTITRTVRDQAIMLDVLTGGEHHYAENLDATVLEGMRIGVLKELSYQSGGYKRVGSIDPEVARVFEGALQRLRYCGVEIVEVSMPNLLAQAEGTMYSNNSAKKQALYNSYLKALEQYDVSCLIFPSYLSAPQRSGKDASGTVWSVYTQDSINNCRILSPSASLPEISIPIGTHSLGAGIGMEIAAPREQEQLLLNIAYAFLKKSSVRTVPGGAPNTYAAYDQGSLTELITWQTKVEETEPPPETTVPTTLPPEPVDTQKTVDLLPFFVVAAVLLVLVSVLTVVLIVKAVKRKQKDRVL